MASTLVLEVNGREYPLTARGVIIGRGMGSQINLSDSEVSRRHATVWLSQGIPYIRDERSKNGTFVNGERIQRERMLRVGDRIKVGNTFLTVRMGVGAAATSDVGILIAGLVGVLILIGSVIIFFVSPVVTPIRTSMATFTSTPTATWTAIPTSTPTPTPTPTWDPDQARQRALLTIVQLIVPDDDWELGFGSGSLVSPQGHILTNFHVIGDHRTGRLHNVRGLIFVALNATDREGRPNIAVPPVVTYMAELERKDMDLDIALIRVVKTIEKFQVPVTRDMLVDEPDLRSKLKAAASWGGLPIDPSLRFPAIPIGDSEKVKVNDPLIIIGFPLPTLLPTVTVTRGIVSGFAPQGGITQAWIKTDTEVNRGNSGGMALNERFELIGIPTGLVERVLSPRGKIGLIRAINVARDPLRLATPTPR